MSWIVLATSSSGTWGVVAEGGDDWIDPRHTIRLTEDGIARRTEDGRLRVIEEMSAGPISRWIPA
jgi:hypothetical protein